MNLPDNVIDVFQISTTRDLHLRKGVIPSLPLKRVSYNGAFIKGLKRVSGDADGTTNVAAEFGDSGVVFTVSLELQSAAPLSSRLDPHECGVSPISSFLELGDINSKSNVADGCFMLVLVIPKTWVQDPRFHSMPSPTPTKGSMGLLSCSDLGGSLLTEFEIPKSWVQDPRFHSMLSPTPTKGSMGLLSCSDLGGSLLTEFEIPKSWVSDLVSVTTTSPTMGSMELLSNGSDSFSDPFEVFDGSGAGAVCSDIWILTTGGQPSGSHLPANYIDTYSSDAHALKVHDANDAGNVDDGVADVKDTYIAISGVYPQIFRGVGCRAQVR